MELLQVRCRPSSDPPSLELLAHGWLDRSACHRDIPVVLLYVIQVRNLSWLHLVNIVKDCIRLGVAFLRKLVLLEEVLRLETLMQRLRQVVLRSVVIH